LFKNLNDVTQKSGAASVHLFDFPAADATAIDNDLLERMDYAQRISSLILSLRKKENIRVRQPLSRILLPVLNPSFKDQVEAVRDLILAEVNIKEIEYITDTEGVIHKKAKPNFKTLGRKLGKDMKAAGDLIAALDQKQIADIERSGSYTLVIGDHNYDLVFEDFEITSEDIPGWTVASDKGITVALDVHISSELYLEGVARELVNRIQNIRKESDFEVTDRIVVSIESHELIQQTLASFQSYISNEVLADDIRLVAGTGTEALEIVEGVSVGISVGVSR
jgi:isoleucyl-tRNA synthetase